MNHLTQREAVFQACDAVGPLKPSQLKDYVKELYGRGVSPATICNFTSIWKRENGNGQDEVKPLRIANQAMKHHDLPLAQMDLLLDYAHGKDNTPIGRLNALAEVSLKFKGTAEMSEFAKCVARLVQRLEQYRKAS